MGGGGAAMWPSLSTGLIIGPELCMVQDDPGPAESTGGQSRLDCARPFPLGLLEKYTGPGAKLSLN